MKSTQVFNRMHSSSSHGIGNGRSQSQDDDDICSLNSWSDDIVVVNRNHLRTQPPPSSRTHSLSSSRSLSSDSYKGDLRSNLKQSNIPDNKNSHVEYTRKSKRLLNSDYGQNVCQDVNNINITSGTNNIAAAATMTYGHVKPKATAASQRNSKGKVKDSDHTSHPSYFPLSLDFKSASFERPLLWENHLSSTSNSENQFPGIKNVKQQSYHSKPKEFSSPSPVNNAQNLDELRDNETIDKEEFQSVPNYNSYSSSKTSPRSSRPQFFDYQSNRSNYSKVQRQRDVNGQFQTSSSVDARFALQDVRAQHAIDREVSQVEDQSLNFNSQPILSSQNTGLSLKPNNSSNDRESINKQNWEHLLERENVKSKIMTVWNNIRYGWTFKPKSNIKLDSPLFMLGKVYHKRSDAENEEPEFLQDFSSLIWLTYRSNFYPIPGTKFTTDCGWGCMLRSGQMLMAQCFTTHLLGRDWCRQKKDNKEAQRLFNQEVLHWFTDPIEAPSDSVPFCLHNLVNIGRNYSKVPGDWYGPSSVAYIFRDALTRASLSIPILNNLCIYVAQDCTVFIDDVNQLCRTDPKSDSGETESINRIRTQHSSADVNPQEDASQQSSFASSNSPWRRSLIILIPVRLGGEAINEIYLPCIQSLLSYNHCTGIIGGKPKHSLYFVGYQENKLIYLDPHYCQEAVDTSHKKFSSETFHCTSPRKLSMNKMDPSCTIGFYIKDAEEFNNFVHDVTKFVSPPQQRGLYPLFIFSKGSQQEADLANGQIGIEQGRVKVKHYIIDENGQKHRTFTRESEEFVML